MIYNTPWERLADAAIEYSLELEADHSPDLPADVLTLRLKRAKDRLVKAALFYQFAPRRPGPPGPRKKR